MAQTVPRLINQKALHVLCYVSFLFLMQKANAFEFKVGGWQGNWTVPSDPNSALYNQWAEKNRFQIGDTLLFVYDANHDSVLHVTKDDYTNCNTGAPLEKFTDGHTVFKFNQSGPYYFISGVSDNCHKNEKMVVVVMADRSGHNSTPPIPSSPSPAPGEESPSGVTIAPSQDSSPPKAKNDASSSVSAVLGTVAAFVGSSLVLVV
ncbi:hypothetical protein CDL12_12229 [Handroanthus impetiginosus]|uniref:Phytocyanin domain-containing protein n=1 Tax=Handroanthus impetiginosus TaxID=429701 RepID=A0A2G9HCV8_9LAMI|nr:hypothetical protein CDL12_12229 [Handroanthus impetiginosus]